jgi:hypothetical protein
MSCSRPSQGQQAPPARAAAWAVRALRNAHGSLLFDYGDGLHLDDNREY